MDCHTGPGVSSSALGGEQTDEAESLPLINQIIAVVSLVPHVNTAGDPRHVVTLVGCLTKTADTVVEMNNGSNASLFISHGYRVERTNIKERCTTFF